MGGGGGGSWDHMSSSDVGSYEFKRCSLTTHDQRWVGELILSLFLLLSLLPRAMTVHGWATGAPSKILAPTSADPKVTRPTAGPWPLPTVALYGIGAKLHDADWPPSVRRANAPGRKPAHRAGACQGARRSPRALCLCMVALVATLRALYK